MTRETLIVLIEKDINELRALTKGFSEMTEFPKPLVDLALSKVDNLRHCLVQLPDAIRPIRHDEEKPMADAIETSVSKDTVVAAETPVVNMPQEPVVENHAEVTKMPQESLTMIIEQDVEVTESVTIKVEKENASQTLADTIHKPASMADLLVKEDNSLASSIAKQSISDIRQALSIADRFRFQRELFGGNGEKLNQALSDLNQVDSFEQAQAYVVSNFTWSGDDSTVIDFMNLVQRRYI